MDEYFQLPFYNYVISGQPFVELPLQKIFIAFGEDMLLSIRVHWKDGLLYRIRYSRKLQYDEQMAFLIVKHFEKYLLNKFMPDVNYSFAEYSFHE
jgi:hypothetical protein